MPWQPAQLHFPDVETVIPAKLRTALDDDTVYVGRDVSNPRRPKMVCCNRDGGSVSGTRDRARLRVRVWATTEADANDLAALVVAKTLGLADGSPVLRVQHLSGPYEIPDESGQPCRYLLFQIDTRGVAA